MPYVNSMDTHCVTGSVSPSWVYVLPATVFMEHSCREACSHSASQIFGLSANPKVRYCLHECWPVVHPEPDDSCALLPYFSECMPSAQNFGLCKQNHCETASCTSTSFWNLWPPRCFFMWAKKMELTWYKVRVVQHIWDTPIQIATAKSWKKVIFVVVTDAKLMWTCTKLLHSGSAQKAHNSVLKVYVPWKYIVTNAWTFRLAIWKGRLLFSCFMRNFILNKTFPNKQLFSAYSYFLISPHVLLMFLPN